MNHLPQSWGRPRDDVYGPYDHSHLQSHPQSHTQQPIVTGTSVVAVKFKDGVVIAADNLASYGSLARFTDVKRLRRFNSRICLGFGGDVSDMQYIDRLLTSLSVRENFLNQTEQASSASSNSESDDKATALNAKNLHTYLSKVMYNRRSKIDPLWNVILIAGLDGAEAPFLAQVDLLGTTFSAPALATGFGAHLATPILRKTVPNEAAAQQLDRAGAEKLVRECMKVLFYRDARSSDSFSIAVISKELNDVELKESEKLENQSWAFAEGIRGYGTQTV